VKNIPFYVRQALSNMNHNRQRTLFVLFSIAVGVAAVVSLRTLGLMIGDSLTRNLQADNRGDIVVTVARLAIASGEEFDETLFDTEDGALDADSTSVTSFSAEGIARMRAWAEGKGYEMTVASRRTSPLRVRPEGLAETSELAFPFFVEPERYPLYGETELVTPRDITLDQALVEPYHIVITQRLADALGVGVGDGLRLVGPDTYRVTAIVDDGAEASLRDLNSIFLPYFFLRTDVGAEKFDARPDTVYLKLPLGSDVVAAGEDFEATFKGVGVLTTEDLRAQNEELSENLTELITVMGLVSLLIGGIGIINTMRVVVSRRTQEIGVLKTIGLQGRQITLMFLIEAFLLGLLGSIPGVFLGLAMVTLLQRVAEFVSAQALQFAIYPGAIVMGLVTGVLVTLVFGFLPTLSAGRVRPNVVLYPTDTILPRAGRRLSLLVVIILTAVLGLLVGRILGDFRLGTLMAYGTMIVLGIAVLLFWGLVILLSRLPSFGSIFIKLSQRAIRGQAARTASTLLALVVGMFALSVILLVTGSIINLIDDIMTNQLGGNVIVGSETREADGQLRALLDELDGVRSVTYERIYRAQIVAINGERDVDAILAAARLNAGEEAGLDVEMGMGPPGTSKDAPYDLYRYRLRRFVNAFDIRLASETMREYEVAAGSDVTPAGDKSIVLQESDETEWLGLNVGDALTLNFEGQDERTVTIAGLIARPSSDTVVVSLGDEGASVGSDNVLPDGIQPLPSAYVLDVEEEKVNAALATMSDLPGVFALEVTQLNELVERMVRQLTALPLIVAVLALFAGGVIVANTVSLATLERRRQIGIMKAIGLQSRDVLRLLLLENGLIGLAGGMIGAGIGAVAIVLMGVLSDNPGSFPFLTLVALILLAVAIALGATLVTAYGASREKPLIVLRYE
jgi:putative ABC transport system permease protein